MSKKLDELRARTRSTMTKGAQVTDPDAPRPNTTHYSIAPDMKTCMIHWDAPIAALILTPEQARDMAKNLNDIAGIMEEAASAKKAH